MQCMEENPFASPQTVADAGLADEASPAEKIRRQHLAHEAAIQSIGLLLSIESVGATMAATGLILEALPPPGTVAPLQKVLLIPVGVVFAVLASAFFWAGVGVRNLRPKARLPAILLSALNLVAIPFGTLVGGYSLYLLMSQKGKGVFTPAYARVRAATPQLKHKTSIAAWVGLAVVIVLSGVGAWIIWFEIR